VDVLIVLGISIFFLAILNSLDTPGKVQLWSIPAILFISYFSQRKIFNLITSKKSPYQAEFDAESKSKVGLIGTMLIKEIKNESESYFFDYKKDIHVEDPHEEKIQKISKIILNDTGEIYPAIYDGSSIKNEDKVKVVAELNGSLIVTKEI
jgi:hypothetical protein